MTANCGPSCQSSVASLSNGTCLLDATGQVVRNLVYITPAPIFARLDGTNDGMAGRVIVLRRVPVFGGIATSDMATNEAQPEMDPGVAGLHAILADMASRLDISCLRDMVAVRHGASFMAWTRVIRNSFSAFSSIVRRRFFDERRVLYSMSRSDARDFGWPLVMS